MIKIVTIIFVFLTLYSSAQVSVFSADFQNGLPSEFTFINNDGSAPFDPSYSEPWICIEDPENPIDSIAASTSYFVTPDTADRWMITPELSLGAFGNQISWNAKSQDASFPDDYYILVSTTDNTIESFVDTIGYIEGENFEWTERFVDLSQAGYNDQSIYVAFVLRTYDGFKLYIDDIEVVKEDDTGVNTITTFTYELYPNPVKVKLQINCDISIDEIIILDYKGRKVYIGKDKNIDVSEFNPGLYMINVKTSFGEVTKRFIKY